MPDSTTGLFVAFVILGCGGAIYLFAVALYVTATNDTEARIAYIENDETIVNWDDIMGAKMHIDALRHKLKIIQHSIVLGAHENGFPPILVGSILALWFYLKT